MYLKQVQIWRGGQSTDYRSQQSGHDVELIGYYAVNSEAAIPGSFTIKFGLGPQHKRSRIAICVGPEEFQKVAAYMMKGSPKEARIAFLSAMLEEEQRKS